MVRYGTRPFLDAFGALVGEGRAPTKIIPRNTTLPAAASETFSTAADGQTTVDIRSAAPQRIHGLGGAQVEPASIGNYLLRYISCRTHLGPTAGGGWAEPCNVRKQRPLLSHLTG